MSLHRTIMLSAAALSIAVIGYGGYVGAQPQGGAQQQAQQPNPPLREASTFSGIGDSRARSVALFNEAGKVITHPRCVNCHPVTERPLQGDLQKPHIPKVVRGEGGLGVPGQACTTCHQRENVLLVGTSLKSMPGHPKWQLAPIEMAWEGQPLGAICEQIKDPARNGGKSMAELLEHMAHDDLVGWGWNPGPGREPAPGTQAVFGEIIKAWMDTGAHCP
ncbi:MAG: Putative Isoquinoline 1-oxidoreductase subunit, Mll3835 protein [uncultured Microvirga sp.]|uniref:Isoquinoline 1-oxidoreductase subunit, Mll3835 protein n=1 Tax=uncultured Microvirga sp. TaxID=412392 RepID=A0A6J4LXK8_9HYPH|nr:MAG: Putative Isoquinoline 1-oxidoreductase subunit, Mll3835 protein [uncultured Microvirga sp.]